MVDARAGAGKVQDEPGISYCASSQGSALKMMGKLKKTKQTG